MHWGRRHEGQLPELVDVSLTREETRLEDMPEIVKTAVGKLMTDLVVRTIGRAKRALMSADENDNGFEDW